MGFILSKFRRKKSTQDVLEGLEKEIKRISNNKRQSLVSQSTVVKKLLFYGILFWVIAFGCVFYLYYSAQKTSDYIIFLPILILIPFFFFIFRSVSRWWYHQKISKDDAKLTKLKEEKSKILDEVMETETYKVATQILEKYDPSRLPGNKTTDNRSIVGNVDGRNNVTKGGARPTPLVVSASPLGQQQGAGRGARPGAGGGGGMSGPQSGMDLRKRIVAPPGGGGRGAGPNPPPPGLNQSMTMSSNRKQVAAPVNLNQTVAAISTGGRGSPGPQQVPAGIGGRIMPVPSLPPGGGVRMGAGGPPLPRPIIPRERGIMDRMVEYLVGDGPSNRYALICRQCQSHNGMALREEFEYISYRCCYCHYWNPARKQRPVAPRLPDPPPTPPTTPPKPSSSAAANTKTVAGATAAGSTTSTSTPQVSRKSSSAQDEGSEKEGEENSPKLRKPSEEGGDTTDNLEDNSDAEAGEEIEMGSTEEGGLDIQLNSDAANDIDGNLDDSKDDQEQQNCAQEDEDESPGELENDDLVDGNEDDLVDAKVHHSKHIELINQDARTDEQEMNQESPHQDDDDLNDIVSNQLADDLSDALKEEFNADNQLMTPSSSENQLMTSSTNADDDSKTGYDNAESSSAIIAATADESMEVDT